MLPEAFTLICPDNDLESRHIICSAHQLRNNSNSPFYQKIQIFVGPAREWAIDLDVCPLRELNPDGSLAEGKSYCDIEIANNSRFLVAVEASAHWFRKHILSLNLQWIDIKDNSYTDQQSDNFDQLSSLHQFNSLVSDRQLDDFALKIAMNDHHYLPGLSMLGSSYDELLTIRKMEMAVRGCIAWQDTGSENVDTGLDYNLLNPKSEQSHLYQEFLDNWIELKKTEKEKELYQIKSSIRKNKVTFREFEEITFILAPERYRPFFIDALRIHLSKKDYIKSAATNKPLFFDNWMVFYIKDENYPQPCDSEPEVRELYNKVTAVEFSGSSRYQNVFHEICQSNQYQTLFQLSCNRDPYSTLFSLEPRYGKNAADSAFPISNIINDALAVIMELSRPVRHYSLSCMLPLLRNSEIVPNTKFTHKYRPYKEGDDSDKSSTETEHQNSNNFTINNYYEEKQKKILNEIKSSYKEISDKDNKSCEDLYNKISNEYNNYAINKTGSQSLKHHALDEANYEYMDSNLRGNIFELESDKDKDKDKDKDNNKKGNIEAIKEFRHRPDRGHIAERNYIEESSITYKVSIDDNKEKSVDVTASVNRLRLYENFNGDRIAEIGFEPFFKKGNKEFHNNWIVPFSTEPDDHEPSAGLKYDPCFDTEKNNQKFFPRARLTTDKDTSSWWYDLVFSDSLTLEFLQSMQLIHWLKFSEKRRNLYETFIPYDKENKSDSSSGSDNIIQLLSHLFTNNNKELQAYLRESINQYPDNRMYVNVSYALSGLTPATDEQRQIYDRQFALAHFVDSGTVHQGYAYDKHFTEELIEQQKYRRWYGAGYQSGYNDYCNAYLGSGWFFSNVIAPDHVPQMYLRMLIMAMFYHSALRHFSTEVTKKSAALKGTDTSEQRKAFDDFRDIRRDFISFTNRYWFDQLTQQSQGKEIFTLQKQALGLKHEYNLIKEEMGWADDYIDSLQNKWRQDSSDNLNRIVGGFALLALLFQILSYDNNDIGGIKVYLSIMLTTILIFFATFLDSERIGKIRRLFKNSLLYVVVSANIILFSGLELVSPCEDWTPPFEEDSLAKEPLHICRFVSDDYGDFSNSDTDNNSSDIDKLAGYTSETNKTHHRPSPVQQPEESQDEVSVTNTNQSATAEQQSTTRSVSSTQAPARPAAAGTGRTTKQSVSQPEATHMGGGQVRLEKGKNKGNEELGES